MKSWRVLAFSCLIISLLPLTILGTRGVVSQSSYQIGEAWQRFFSGEFQLAGSLANQSETKPEHTNGTFTFNQMPLPPISSSRTSTTNSTISRNGNDLPIAAVTAAIAIGVVGVWVIRSRRRRASSENAPSVTASKAVEQKGGS